MMNRLLRRGNLESLQHRRDLDGHNYLGNEIHLLKLFHEFHPVTVPGNISSPNLPSIVENSVFSARYTLLCRVPEIWITL